MDVIDIYRIFYQTATKYTSFQQSMELSPKQITYWIIKQTLTNTRKMKLLPVSYQTTME
jgi:hypothetical protein